MPDSSITKVGLVYKLPPVKLKFQHIIAQNYVCTNLYLNPFISSSFAVLPTNNWLYISFGLKLKWEGMHIEIGQDRINKKVALQKKINE